MRAVKQGGAPPLARGADTENGVPGVVAWSKEQMAAYKYPRSVEFLDELPKTTTGKVLRRELRGKPA